MLIKLESTNLFKYWLISGTSSLLLFIFFYQKIEDNDVDKVNYWNLFLYLIALFCVVYIALNYEQVTRWIVLFSFLMATVYLIYKARIESNQAFIFFISLVFLFSIPYWIANTIIFNEFFYFITKDVSSIRGFSSMILITIDPIVNALFGTGILLWQRNRIINHYNNLSYSAFLMTISFIVLCFGLFFSEGKQKINFIYPLITMGLFACAEFLLQTTLNSKIRGLLSLQKSGEFLATGMMRSSRAFATAVGYYLIFLTIPTTQNSNDIHANFDLYLIIILLFISSSI